MCTLIKIEQTCLRYRQLNSNPHNQPMCGKNVLSIVVVPLWTDEAQCHSRKVVLFADGRHLQLKLVFRTTGIYLEFIYHPCFHYSHFAVHKRVVATEEQFFKSDSKIHSPRRLKVQAPRAALTLKIWPSSIPRHSLVRIADSGVSALWTSIWSLRCLVKYKQIQVLCIECCGTSLDIFDKYMYTIYVHVFLLPSWYEENIFFSRKMMYF